MMERLATGAWMGIALAGGMGWCAVGQASSLRVAPSLIQSVDSALVLAIAEVESGGDPRAVGPHGERGLMQIKRETWQALTPQLYGRRLSFARAFDAQANVQVGKAYLRELAGFLEGRRGELRGDPLALLIASYNAGPSALARRGFRLERCSPATRDYVRRVLALRNLFVAEGGAGDPASEEEAGS